MTKSEKINFIMFLIILALLVWETGKSIDVIWHWRRQYAYYYEYSNKVDYELEECKINREKEGCRLSLKERPWEIPGQCIKYLDELEGQHDNKE